MGKSRLAVHYGGLHLSIMMEAFGFVIFRKQWTLRMSTVSTVLSIPLARVHSNEEMQEQLSYAIGGRGAILPVPDNLNMLQRKPNTWWVIGC